MNKLFNPDNPVFEFLEKVFNLMIANVLFIVCSIPVFTIGASLTALFKITQDVVLGNDKGVVKRFFDAFKQNFKQATIAWIVVFLFLCGLGLNLFLVSVNAKGMPSQIFKVLIQILMFVVVGLASYIFPLIARYDNTLKQHYRNSIVLFLMKFPKTLLMMLLNTLIFWIPYFSMEVFISTFVFWLVIGFGFVCYIDTELLHSVFAQLEAPDQDKDE